MPETENPELRMTPDQLCAWYAKQQVKVTVRQLPGEEHVILVEGQPEALEFLGLLFLAQANSPNCGFQLGPHGAGKALFTSESTQALYIHRLPCETDGS